MIVQQSNKKKLTGGAYAKHLKSLPIPEITEEAYCEIKISYEKDPDAPKINSPERAEKVFRKIWDMERFSLQEQMYVLFLDNGCKLLGWKMVTTGLRASVTIDISFIITMAVRTNAARIIIAHNHPSGVLRESKADRDLTEHMFERLQPFLINIEDHLILTKTGFLSFAGDGIFDRYRITHLCDEYEHLYKSTTGGKPTDIIEDFEMSLENLTEKVRLLERKIARKEKR